MTLLFFRDISILCYENIKHKGGNYMAMLIGINMLEHKIKRLIDRRDRALALGKNDKAWKLNMKLDIARNRMTTWCYWNS